MIQAVWSWKGTGKISGALDGNGCVLMVRWKPEPTRSGIYWQWHKQRLCPGKSKCRQNYGDAYFSLSSRETLRSDRPSGLCKGDANEADKYGVGWKGDKRWLCEAASDSGT